MVGATHFEPRLNPKSGDGQEVSHLLRNWIHWLSMFLQVPGAAAALTGGNLTADEDQNG